MLEAQIRLNDEDCDLRPHECRHSYVTHLRAAGINDADLAAKIAGHRVETMLARYTHALEGSHEARSEGNRLDGRLLALATLGLDSTEKRTQYWALASASSGQWKERVSDQVDIKVSDEDIQKIIDANQAGTADLMAFYESAEASYVAAAQAAMSHPPTAAYPASSDTIPLS